MTSIQYTLTMHTIAITYKL